MKENHNDMCQAIDDQIAELRITGMPQIDYTINFDQPNLMADEDLKINFLKSQIWKVKRSNSQIHLFDVKDKMYQELLKKND